MTLIMFKKCPINQVIVTLFSGVWDKNHKTPNAIDQFSKRHRVVHNGGLPKFEALYGSLNIVNSAEIL